MTIIDYLKIHQPESFTLEEGINSYLDSNPHLILAGKAREYADVRFFLFYLLWRECGWSKSKIGRRFNRGHDTVINGIERYEDLKNDKGFQANLNHAKEYLKLWI